MRDGFLDLKLIHWFETYFLNENKMTAAYRQGKNLFGLLPVFYSNPEMFNNVRTLRITVQDNYSKYFERFNVSRNDMLLLTNAFMMVDILEGTNPLPYLDDN